MSITERLQASRARTLAIAQAVPEAVLEGVHSALMGPMVWDLGHIAAFEDLWLVRVLDGYEPPGEEMGLDPLYNPFKNPRAVRGELALPGREVTTERLRQVREEMLTRLTRAEHHCSERLLADEFVWKMVLQHEAWHQETMIVSANLRRDVRFAPSFARPLPRGRAVTEDMVRVPAGVCRVGTDDRVWAYDNERPAQERYVDAFEIDRFPVSNRRFLRFVEEADARVPMGWEATDSGWCAWRFGQLLPLDLREPVMHVSWEEARAFAAWEGKRLPTEAEWSKAARWDPAARESRTYPWGDAPVSSERCNVDHTGLGPAQLGAFPMGASAYGCEQMLGDVWEWVEDPLRPYLGFEAWPYEEFSVPFFETNRVLRGGSWATGAALIRGSLRNWDLPSRRQVFAGFRCARSS